jgi:tetratricopeptide (TPR) repeat protein
MKQPGYYREILADCHDSRSENALCRVMQIARKYGRFCAVVAILLGFVFQASGSSISPTSQATSIDARVAWLIEQLRSDDAATRQSAAIMLVRMGNVIRPAILKLTKSTDPGLAQQGAQILLNLPWYAPEDSPAVREILQRNYSSPDVEIRRDTVRQLATLPDGQGFGALGRLVNEDPSPAVQWTIVTCLRVEEGLDAFRDAKADASNSRSLALCGYAQLSRDLPGALEKLRQCAELELGHATDDDGEFDMVIKLLCQAACQKKQYEQAADWRRRELERGSEADQEGVPNALLELFALHADFGPIKGFEDDMRLAGDDLQKPKIQYALAHMYRRNNDPARADAAQQAGFGGSTNRIQHYDVGEFLYDHGWDALAETELNAFLKTDEPGVNVNGAELSPSEANVLFRLSELAVKRGDDLTAAKDKERAMQLLPEQASLDMVDNDGRRWKVPASTIWAQVYWRYLRAAAAKHDEKEIDRRLEQIMHLRPDDADIAIDAVPILQKRGRTVDANLLFGWAYEPMKRKLDADPDNAENLNGLAWLCAKCDRNLEQAKVWAEKAASIMPDNAAILDTLAEVNFHLGHPEKSLELEEKASGLQPDDSFMKEQLEKYRAAVAKGRAATGHAPAGP